MTRAETSDAIPILDQAAGYTERAGHMLGYPLVALLRGEARIHAQDYEQAWQEMDALRAIATTMPQPFVIGGSLQVQAECALRTGRAELALELFQSAEQVFVKIDAAHRVAQVQAGATRAIAELERTAK